MSEMQLGHTEATQAPEGTSRKEGDGSRRKTEGEGELLVSRGQLALVSGAKNWTFHLFAF